ncbi:MAG: hypothetical protein D6828_02690, partial [Nitrospirae bacterium]
MSDGTKPTEEQLKYASTLHILGLGGLLILLLGFIIYIVELVPSIVPVAQVPKYWSLKVDEYVARTGMPTKWQWVHFLNHADIISFVGIVILASATILCMLIVLPTFLKKKDIP